MIAHGTEIKIFAGNSNKKLAEAIAKELNMTLGDAEVGTFSDGEISVHIGETVRGRDVFGQGWRASRPVCPAPMLSGR